MEIFHHPACTHVIGPPADMQDGSCSSLPVADVQTEDGPFTVSFWKPDANELALLNEGGTVVLYVRASGRQHPVVALTATPAVEPKNGNE